LYAESEESSSEEQSSLSKGIDISEESESDYVPIPTPKKHKKKKKKRRHSSSSDDDSSSDDHDRHEFQRKMKKLLQPKTRDYWDEQDEMDALKQKYAVCHFNALCTYFFASHFR